MTKRILFCWELGDGKGHVLPYRSLRVADLGTGAAVGIAMGHFRIYSTLMRLFENQKYAEAAEAFCRRHEQSTPEHAAKIAFKRCLALLEPVKSHDRRMAIAV